MLVRCLNQDDMIMARDLYCDSFLKEKHPLELELLGNLFGLFLEKELIGIVQVDFINHVFENKRIAYINCFCIKKEYRHLGYGDYLLKWCIGFAKDNKVDVIQMTSNKNRVYAHMLYEKNGFEPIDTILLKKDI